ncbi:DUF2203 domain-containing protein [candidate division TA06 bacterium]|nr:DUF2203 domain-containing protein [candidate division TA06 bacterium]
MRNKLFTVEEANAFLHFLEESLNIIQAKTRRVRTLDERVSVLSLVSESGASPENPDVLEYEEKKEELNRLVGEIDQEIKAILDRGCLIKDLKQGLIDFYWVREGEVVLLCWKKGEKEIGFWHTLEGGFAGRKALK